MSNYNAGYDFEPNDSVWVVNRTLQSVNHGTCIQVDIKIYPDSAYVPVPTPVYGITPTPSPNIPIIDHLIYWVILDNTAGSVKVMDGDIFATLSEALSALGADITPTPTPTPSITCSVTPTQTPTPTITATSGTTPTATPTMTPSPTTTITVSPTISQTATFVPSQTPTVTPTITPSNSVLLSALVTGAGEPSVDGVYTYTGFSHNGHQVFYFNGIAGNVQQIVYLSYNNNWCIIDSSNTPAYYSANQNIAFPWQTTWVTNFGAAPAPNVNSELTPITPTPSVTATHTPTPTVTPTPS